jgi:hypothetical protein
MDTLTNGRLLTNCSECDNKADVWADDPRPLCEFCSHAEECDPPRKIFFGNARISGEYRAYCHACQFVSAYFECGCDLQHECKDWR